MARDFVDALFSSLRERMPALSSGVVILVGGGAALLRGISMVESMKAPE